MDERVVPEPTSAVSTEFPGSGARTGLFSVLRVRNFRLLWIGEAISVLGDQVHFVALPWLVLQLTGDPLAMGSVLALAGIPRAVFMLVGGAFTDRFSPRTIMLLSNVARMILVGAMAALVLMGRIDLWMLYGFALVFGLIDAFFYPASIAIVPALLPQHQLQSGNALVQGTAQISVLLGPLLGGALIASFGGGTATVDGVSTADLTGTGLALALDALTFLISAVTLRLIHEPARRQPSDGATPASGVMQDILDGLKTAWNDVALRFVVLISAAINFLVNGPILIGIPVLADTRFAQGAAAFGIVMSAYGGGSLVGTLLAGSLPKPAGRRLGPLLMVIISALGFGLMGLAYASQTWIAAVVTALMGAANGYVNIIFITWLQGYVPQRLMGRVMSLLMFAGVGLTPVAMVLAGALTSWNVTSFLAGAGLLVALITLYAASRPTMRALGTRTWSDK